MCAQLNYQYCCTSKCRAHENRNSEQLKILLIDLDYSLTSRQLATDILPWQRARAHTHTDTHTDTHRQTHTNTHTCKLSIPKYTDTYTNNRYNFNYLSNQLLY